MKLLNNYSMVNKKISSKFLPMLENGTQQFPNHKFVENGLDPRSNFEKLSKDINFWKLAWQYYCESVEYTTTYNSNNFELYATPNDSNLISGEINNEEILLKFYVNNIMATKLENKFHMVKNDHVLCRYSFTEKEPVLLDMFKTNNFYKALYITDEVECLHGIVDLVDISGKKIVLANCGIIQNNCLEKTVKEDTVTATFIVDVKNIIGYK